MTDSGAVTRAAGQTCRRCGEPLEPLYVAPDCGLFVTCRCGPCPAAQSVPLVYFYIAAAGVISAAALFFLIFR